MSANVIDLRDFKAKRALWQIETVLEKWIEPGRLSDEHAASLLLAIATPDVRRAACGRTPIDVALSQIISILDREFPSQRCRLNIVWEYADKNAPWLTGKGPWWRATDVAS